MKRGFLIVAMIMTGNAMAQAPTGDAADSFALECPGEGSDTDTIKDGGGRNVDIDQKFSASVQVEISAGAGRVRLPEMMIPSFSSSTGENWFKLSGLKIEPNRIVADVRTNFMNIQSLEIDRRSGNLRIEGRGSQFYGRCDRAPTTNRF